MVNAKGRGQRQIRGFRRQTKKVNFSSRPDSCIVLYQGYPACTTVSGRRSAELQAGNGRCRLCCVNRYTRAHDSKPTLECRMVQNAVFSATQSKHVIALS